MSFDPLMMRKLAMGLGFDSFIQMSALFRQNRSRRVKEGKIGTMLLQIGNIRVKFIVASSLELINRS